METALRRHFGAGGRFCAAREDGINAPARKRRPKAHLVRHPVGSPCSGAHFSPNVPFWQRARPKPSLRRQFRARRRFSAPYCCPSRRSCLCLRPPPLSPWPSVPTVSSHCRRIAPFLNTINADLGKRDRRLRKGAKLRDVGDAGRYRERRAGAGSAGRAPGAPGGTGAALSGEPTVQGRVEICFLSYII